MKKSIVILCWLLGSCQSNETTPVSTPETEDTTFYQAYAASSKVPETRRSKILFVKFKSIREIVSDTNSFSTYWRSIHFYPNLNFAYKKGMVTMEFDGQCEYTYPIKVTDKSITVFYDMQEDCTHDIGIKSTFGLKNYPQKGLPFFVLTLVNDTTLQADYLYKDWVNKVNALHPKYPCYVKRFYAKTRDL